MSDGQQEVYDQIKEQRSRTIVYVSGKYTADTYDGRQKNIEIARDFTIKLWKKGYSVICPHLNTANLDEEGIDWTTFINGDLEQVRRSDIMFMLPNWKESKGAKIERDEALDCGKRVVYKLEELI